ncbi:unnamed protein product [Peronospora belbahrii]|uniref:Uncharacterized protein n=1 Tax=Peronospora belbahrii TaxID=622444 RepID=A0AAU9KLS2_9STRA|nr:unnamed protein product [Peronospora belbahrii]
MEKTLNPGAVSMSCRARRYSLEQRDVWLQHIQELLDAGLCYQNPKVDGVRYLILPFQIAMAELCQGIDWILIKKGVVTPTRILMGGINRVADVQATVQAMFEAVFNKGLLILIDDLLGRN